MLALGAAKHHEALVELDASVDASAAEELHEVLAVGGNLINGLLKKDNTADALLNLGRGEKQLAIGASVWLGVFDLDALESTADGARALVSGEDALSSGADVLSGLDEFLLEGLFGVDHSEK